jgi:hypothetical protein
MLSDEKILQKNINLMIETKCGWGPLIFLYKKNWVFLKKMLIIIRLNLIVFEKNWIKWW